jgi:hypothetical protein
MPQEHWRRVKLQKVYPLGISGMLRLIADGSPKGSVLHELGVCRSFGALVIISSFEWRLFGKHYSYRHGRSWPKVRASGDENGPGAYHIRASSGYCVYCRDRDPQSGFSMKDAVGYLSAKDSRSSPGIRTFRPAPGRTRSCYDPDLLLPLRRPVPCAVP